MKKYQIWSEGYVITGMNGIPAKAMLHGTSKGKNFKDACIKFFSIKTNDERGDFDSKWMTFWGCRIYDNQREARKLFG